MDSGAWLDFLLSNPKVVGIVTWSGIIVTVVGLSIAIGQIRRTRTAAEAASEAAKKLVSTVASRERLLQLKTATANVESAKERIIQKEYNISMVFLESSLNECVHVQELLLGSDRRRISKIIVRLKKISEDIASARESNQENESSFQLGAELREIIGMMHELSARLRYAYEDVEP